MTGRIGYNHSTTCRERIRAEMQKDPEYRRLMHKHELHHEAGQIEILTEAQVNERRHNVQRAINVIEREARKGIKSVEQQLTHTMVTHLLAKIEVAEIYSPPRVTEMAQRMGLKSGWALDITTTYIDVAHGNLTN